MWKTRFICCMKKIYISSEKQHLHNFTIILCMFAHLWLPSHEKSLDVNLQGWNWPHYLSSGSTQTAVQRTCTHVHGSQQHLGTLVFSTLPVCSVQCLCTPLCCSFTLNARASALGWQRPTPCFRPCSKEDVSNPAQSTLLLKLDSPANPFSR